MKTQKKPIGIKSIRKYEMDELDSRRLDFIFSHKATKNPYVEVKNSLNDDLKGRRKRFEGVDMLSGKRKNTTKA